MPGVSPNIVLSAGIKHIHQRVTIEIDYNYPLCNKTHFKNTLSGETELKLFLPFMI